jgi:uncharacterized protein (TIGR02996 family)
MTFYPHIQAPRPQVRAFFEDIRENPLDETPRLVLADWLQEFGDELEQARGEFIYGQCLLAKSTVAPVGLARRVVQLEAKYAKEWLGPLVNFIDVARFERGMCHVRMDAFACHDSRLIELLPTETFAWVEGLVLCRATGGLLNVLRNHPLLSHIRSLTLDDCRFGYSGLAELVSLPDIAKLHELNLAFCQGNHEFVTRLCSGPELALRTLDLTRNFIGDAGVAALANSHSLPELTELRLAFNHLPGSSMTLLAASPLMSQLEHLDLRGNSECGGEGLARLLEHPAANRLKTLQLAQVLLTPDTLRRLASAALPNLTHLWLDRGHLGAELPKRLAFGSGLPALRHLSLGRNQLGNDAINALADSTALWQLRSLNLNNNYIDEEGVRVLANSPNFASLEELNLQDNALSDEAAYLLIESPYLTRLKVLDVDDNSLSPMAFALLRQRFPIVLGR